MLVAEDQTPSPLDPGIPRRVLRWLDERGGIHNDCLLANDPCKPCRDKVMGAFEAAYAEHAETEGDVIAAIIEDFRQDHIADGP